MNWHKKIAVVFILAVLGVGTLLVVWLGISLSVEHPLNREALESRVKVGDEREYARQVLSDAWFYTECRAGDSAVVRDLYFYGPRDPNEAIVLIIESEKANGETKVRFVGSVDNYLLHIYDYCTPSPTRAFQGD